MTNFHSSAIGVLAAFLAVNPAAATPTEWEQGYEIGFDAGVVATACEMLVKDQITSDVFIDKIKYVYRTNKSDMKMHAEIMADNAVMKPCLDAYNAVF